MRLGKCALVHPSCTTEAACDPSRRRGAHRDRSSRDRRISPCGQVRNPRASQAVAPAQRVCGPALVDKQRRSSRPATKDCVPPRRCARGRAACGRTRSQSNARGMFCAADHRSAARSATACDVATALPRPRHDAARNILWTTMPGIAAHARARAGTVAVTPDSDKCPPRAAMRRSRRSHARFVHRPPGSRDLVDKSCHKFFGPFMKTLNFRRFSGLSTRADRCGQLLGCRGRGDMPTIDR